MFTLCRKWNAFRQIAVTIGTELLSYKLFKKKKLVAHLHPFHDFRNFFLTQFKDGENLETDGILEVDLGNLSLGNDAKSKGNYVVLRINCGLILEFI